MTTASDNAAAMQRVSIVKGDRCCISCGFNLHGQPVLREPVYSMLIVRCPECATCVAIQEYPTLGLWARRWAAALVAVWIGALLGAILLSVSIVSGISSEMINAASTQYGREISREFLAHDRGREYVTARYGGAGNVPVQHLSPNPWTPIDGVWWDALEGKDAIFARSGGYGAALRETSTHIFGIVLTAAITGVLLAGLVPHLRGTRLLLPALVWATIAAAAAWLFLRESPVYWGVWISASQYGAARFAMPIAALGVGVGFVVLAIALQVGRPVLRWLASAFTPPRLRIGLSALWICDGKDPPRLAEPVSAPPPRRSA